MENHLSKDELAEKIPSSKRKQIHEREKWQTHKYNCISIKREEKTIPERQVCRHREESTGILGAKKTRTQLSLGRQQLI